MKPERVVMVAIRAGLAGSIVAVLMEKATAGLCALVAITEAVSTTIAWIDGDDCPMIFACTIDKMPVNQVAGLLTPRSILYMMEEIH